MMTTSEKITNTVWCEECQADVTLSRDAMGFWCCDVCGRTPQDVEGTRYDDDDLAALARVSGFTIEATVPEGESALCPNCAGTGNDPKTMICVMCGGDGRLEG